MNLSKEQLEQIVEEALDFYWDYPELLIRFEILNIFIKYACLLQDTTINASYRMKLLEMIDDIDDRWANIPDGDGDNDAKIAIHREETVFFENLKKDIHYYET